MSETRFDLLTIGEAMVLVAPDDHGSIEIDAHVFLGAGGAESNVAIGAAALGLTTAWLSRIGPGALGDLVRASVARRGVDVSHVTVDPTRPTGLMVKHAGQHASEVFYYRAGSAATDLSPSDLDGIAPPAVVHISGILAALSLSTKALAAFHRGDGPRERLTAGHAAAAVVLRSHSDQAPFESLSSMEASIDV